jgi:hypothetical protein
MYKQYESTRALLTLPKGVQRRPERSFSAAKGESRGSEGPIIESKPARRLQINPDVDLHL